MLLDKRGLLSRIGTMSSVVLEFGCGPNKARKDAIAIDCLDLECVDVVGDAMEVLNKIPASTVDEITSAHFLEHLLDVRAFLAECSRVLKPGGIFRATVPHFSNPYYYSDITHRIPFGIYTFSYLAHDRVFERKVPAYQERMPLDVISVRLVFGSFSRRRLRHWLKKIPQILVNSCTFAKEVYEENFCYLVPCYEVEFLLKKN